MEILLVNQNVFEMVTGARYDVSYRKNTNAETTFNVVGIAVTAVKVRLYYQANGTLIKEWDTEVPSSPVGGLFTWVIAPAELAELKPLNYFWEAVDDETELLAYGNFKLF
jgi:hypothetical protein